MQISEFVSKYDLQNQFKVLIDTYTQIEYAWDNKFDLSKIKNEKINSILISGLGGSAISAGLMKNFLRKDLNIPFIVNRNYFLPEFVNEETLVIISSYSGNTEETYSVLQQAIERNCMIACITTGGKIESLAVEKNITVVKVLKGYQPRYSLGLSFFTLLKILQELQIVSNHDEVVQKIISLWKDKGIEYSKDGNAACNYAEKIIGFIPVIYSADDITSAAGYRFKCQFNENSKLHAFQNVIPELNHNELIGWETFSEKQMNAKLINILDKEYHPQVAKRFKITSQLASVNKVEIINLESSENDFKVRLMDIVYLCDWITYYTAILRHFDPSEIRNIDTMKERLM
jgi:glucose/mannose-6-phosphate isomerase